VDNCQDTDIILILCCTNVQTSKAKEEKDKKYKEETKMGIQKEDRHNITIR
jgi:hypothetical protein